MSKTRINISVDAAALEAIDAAAAARDMNRSQYLEWAALRSTAASDALTVRQRKDIAARIGAFIREEL